MDFKEVGEFAKKILKRIDEYDDVARQIITDFLPILPEVYRPLVEGILSGEKKVVDFLVDLLIEVEDSGLKKDAKLAEAVKKCENSGISELVDNSTEKIKEIVGFFDKIIKKI